jgi:hypothetical protein
MNKAMRERMARVEHGLRGTRVVRVLAAGWIRRCPVCRGNAVESEPDGGYRCIEPGCGVVRYAYARTPEGSIREFPPGFPEGRVRPDEVSA